MHRLHYHFGVVLALILSSLALGLAAPDTDGWRLAVVALQAATLVAAVIASLAHQRVIRMTLAASASIC